MARVTESLAAAQGRRRFPGLWLSVGGPPIAYPLDRGEAAAADGIAASDGRREEVPLELPLSAVIDSPPLELPLAAALDPPAGRAWYPWLPTLGLPKLAMPKLSAMLWMPGVVPAPRLMLAAAGAATVVVAVVLGGALQIDAAPDPTVQISTDAISRAVALAPPAALPEWLPPGTVENVRPDGDELAVEARSTELAAAAADPAEDPTVDVAAAEPAMLPPVPRPRPRLVEMAPQPVPAPAPVPAAIPEVRQPRIQLAALRTPEGARRNWEALRSANPEVLGHLSASVVRVDLRGKGTFYRVLAGPLADASEAAETCATLRQRRMDCLVVRP